MIHKKLTPGNFEKAFGEKLNQYVRGKIRRYNFCYRQPTQKERDVLVKKILEVLLDQSIEPVGRGRLSKWEKGWNENLNKYQKLAAPKNLSPIYFGKYKCIRWNQDFIIPLSKNFEENSLSLIENWLFDKYLRRTKTIYEFGCGTGHNLLSLRAINPKAKIWGLDWAKSSQKLIEEIRKKTSDHNIYGRNFDFFNPDPLFKLDKKGVVVTVASLEQTGREFKKFIDYLLKEKPKLVIHIEPIYELLDKNNLFDYLSLKYFQKRNYLWGLLDYLRRLEIQKKIKIIRAQRTYVGSLFIDGYSVVIWKTI